MPTRLPPRPEFESIEAAAPDTASRRTLILALIGNISFTWSNNESMFVYVLMLLLETDQASAAIVFSTLNTTRARLDLVQRLAAVWIADKDISSRLDDIVERFNACTKVRNDLNHCMFGINESGEITHTQTMRITESRGRVRFGAVRAIDEARIVEMNEVVASLVKLNRDIWDFLPALEAHMARRRKGHAPIFP